VRYLRFCDDSEKDEAAILKTDIEQAKKKRKKIHKTFVSKNFAADI